MCSSSPTSSAVRCQARPICTTSCLVSGLTHSFRHYPLCTAPSQPCMQQQMQHARALCQSTIPSKVQPARCHTINCQPHPSPLSCCPTREHKVAPHGAFGSTHARHVRSNPVYKALQHAAISQQVAHQQQARHASQAHTSLWVNAGAGKGGGFMNAHNRT